MNTHLKRFLTGLFLLLAGWVLWVFTPPLVLSLVISAIIGSILVLEWPAFHLWWLTPIYPVAPFFLLIALNQSCYREVLLFLSLITFAHDTGAYLVGTWMGKHRITPISPKKSWEGFAGGYCFSFVAAVFVCYYTNVQTFSAIPFLVLLYNFAALGGDLFESYLKRRVGLKDSGNVLPGHGGLLDRFDSLLAVIVVFYCLRWLAC